MSREVHAKVYALDLSLSATHRRVTLVMPAEVATKLEYGQQVTVVVPEPEPMTKETPR